MFKITKQRNLKIRAPRWRNRYTRRSQKPLGASPWEFESPTRHLEKRLSKNKKLKAYVVGLSLGDGNLSNPNGRAVRLRITCDKKYPNLIQNIYSTFLSPIS